MNETEIALKLANYVLDKEMDPDADICILARQFIRQRETVRSLLQASGGHIFVRDADIRKGNADTLALVVERNEADNGCDVFLKPVQ